MKALLFGLGVGFGIAAYKNMPQIQNPAMSVWVIAILVAIGAALMIGYRMGGGGAHAESTAVAIAEADASAGAAAQAQVVLNVGNFQKTVSEIDAETRNEIASTHHMALEASTAQPKLNFLEQDHKALPAAVAFPPEAAVAFPPEVSSGDRQRSSRLTGAPSQGLPEGPSGLRSRAQLDDKKRDLDRGSES